MSRGSVNKVILIGNLGADPEVRYTQNQDAMATINIATSESWRDKNTGENRERTEWHRVVFFGKLAEIVQQYLRKGSKVYVEGQLRTRKWQDKDGQDRYTTEVFVGINGTMQMLDSRPGGGSSVPFDDGPPAQSGGRGFGGGAPQGQAAYGGGSGGSGGPDGGGAPGGAPSGAPPSRSYDDFDDEVPF